MFKGWKLSLETTLENLQRLSMRSPLSAVLFVGFLTTASISFIFFDRVQRDERDRFDRAAKGVAESVEVRFRVYINALIATRSFVEANAAEDHTEVTLAEYRDFIDGLELQKNFPGLQALGYVPWIASENLEEYSQRVRKNIWKDFKVWPTQPRDDYTTILFLEPADWRNRRALGFDMMTEPKRRAAMLSARDTGQLAVTERITLVQETTLAQQAGFIVYAPIYKQGHPTDTVENRRLAIAGFNSAVFRAGDLFQQISYEFSDKFPRVRIKVFDGINPAKSELLFNSATGEEEGRHVSTLTVPVADQRWAITVASTPSFEVGSARSLPWFILILGTIITLLTFLVLGFARRFTLKLVEDLAEKEATRNEIEKAKRAAEEANRAKSQFLANMSHEIRTPLGVITGFSDLALSSSPTPDEMRNYLTTIKRNSQQLTTLVGEILDLSKIEANKLEVEKIRFSLPKLLDEVVNSLALRANEKGIDLVLELEKPIPECILTDPTRLRQILVNLIGNAIKFTEKGRVTVSAELLSIAEIGADVRLRVTIKDTGIGISPEHRDGLFLPFHQGDTSMTRKYGGTGLGLMLSKQLARALGGDLEMRESELGLGSVFTFTIEGGPFEGFWDPTSAAKAATADVAPHLSQPLSGKRILLAEDVKDNQILFSRYLKRAGAWIDIANNGAEAITMIEKQNYDVILMDIQMPILDGLGATSQIRALGHRVPIIALTAHALREEREKALGGGFDDYLTKPLSSTTLVETIERHVN